MESMTGFGRGSSKLENFQVICLAKSVNHRFLEINLKLPKKYTLLEERIRKKITEFFERGKIEVLIKVYGFSFQKREIFFDLELAKSLRNNLQLLKNSLGLSGEITLAEIIQFREISLVEEKDEEVEILWEEIRSALEEALIDLKNSRLKEGYLLKEKIKEYLFIIKNKIEKILALKDKVKEENIKKMKERIEKLLEEFKGRLDEARLYQEITLWLDRMDFSEELDRFIIHLNSAQQLLDIPNSGKKLDFICQELMREINTLSTKAQSAEISLIAVEIKDFIEKIREQVQNVA